MYHIPVVTLFCRHVNNAIRYETKRMHHDIMSVANYRDKIYTINISIIILIIITAVMHLLKTKKVSSKRMMPMAKSPRPQQ